MTVHFMDSIVFGDSVGTADMRRVFEETSSFQRWLDVEVALAKAQASMGMIPQEAAETIAAKADVALIDLEAVKASGKRTGHSLLGLLADFRRVIAQRPLPLCALRRHDAGHHRYRPDADDQGRL